MAHELSEQQGVDALVGTEADEGPADLRYGEPFLDSGLGGDGLEDVGEAGLPQGLEHRAEEQMGVQAAGPDPQVRLHLPLITPTKPGSTFPLPFGTGPQKIPRKNPLALSCSQDPFLSPYFPPRGDLGD